MRFLIIAAFLALQACASGVVDYDPDVPMAERPQDERWRCLVDFGVAWNGRYFPEAPLPSWYAGGAVRIVPATQSELQALYIASIGPVPPHVRLTVKAITTTMGGKPAIIVWDAMDPDHAPDAATMGGHEPHHVRQQLAGYLSPIHPGYLGRERAETDAREATEAWRREFPWGAPDACD